MSSPQSLLFYRIICGYIYFFAFFLGLCIVPAGAALFQSSLHTMDFTPVGFGYHLPRSHHRSPSSLFVYLVLTAWISPSQDLLQGFPLFQQRLAGEWLEFTSGCFIFPKH